MLEKRTTEISVIMPVYNAAEYLPHAIESILRQTYRDFELLLVDDGSSDGSANICDAYAQKDDRIMVFHQENRGICAARNRGLDAARGKYIAFCDHDDLYKDDCLETLWDEAEKTGAQLVRGNFQVFRLDKNGEPAVTQTGGDRRVELTAQTAAYYDYIIQSGPLFIWNCLFSRDVIQKYDLRFNEDSRYGMEDFQFCARFHSHMEHAIYLPKVVYLHYERSFQSMSRVTGDESIMQRIRMLESFIRSAYAAAGHWCTGRELRIVWNQRRGFIAAILIFLCMESNLPAGTIRAAFRDLHRWFGQYPQKAADAFFLPGPNARQRLGLIAIELRLAAPFCVAMRFLFRITRSDYVQFFKRYRKNPSGG